MGAVVWFLISRMELWLVAAIAYFCGCFNGAVIISKYILRDDVRRHGSGNAGLTNFYRTFGGPLTFVVILCDVLKAVIAVLIAAHIGGGFDPRMMPDMPLSTEMTVYYVVLFKYWAALFCLLGHMFPCMFHFKGGKGILSGGTIRWKCYRAEDYPTPEAVARRCAAGLIACHAPDDEAPPCDARDNDNGFRAAHGLPLRVRWECWGRLSS